MTPQETIDQLIDYIDNAVARASVSNRQVATVLDFLNEKLRSQEGGVSIESVKGKGSTSLPVYFDRNGLCQVISSLLVPGTVVGQKGVAAGGIADLSVSQSPSNLEVLEYSELEGLNYESSMQVATAYSVATLRAFFSLLSSTVNERTNQLQTLINNLSSRINQSQCDGVPFSQISDETSEDVSRIATAHGLYRLLDHLGIDRFDEFSIHYSYLRGESVLHNGKAYRFNSYKEPGPWDPSYCDRIDYTTLLNPLPILDSTINSLS